MTRPEEVAHIYYATWVQVLGRSQSHRTLLRMGPNRSLGREKRGGKCRWTESRTSAVLLLLYPSESCAAFRFIDFGGSIATRRVPDRIEDVRINMQNL